MGSACVGMGRQGKERADVCGIQRSVQLRPPAHGPADQ